MAKQPLSRLAADAAWEAFNKVLERIGVFEDYGDALAAAFRAAAAVLRDGYASEEPIDSPDDFLDAIAAELETTTTDNP